jgi:lipopolysaccharide export system protein LptA
MNSGRAFVLGAALTLLMPALLRAADSGVSLSTSVFVTGDTMQILEQGRKTRFIGHVKIRSRDTGLVWEGFGDEGLYDTEKNTMTLWREAPGRARLVRHPKNQPEPITLELYGIRIETDSRLTFVHAEGNAYGTDISTTTHQSLRFWAESADYNQTRSLIWLAGNQPLLIIDKPAERRTVTGKTIRYLIDQQKLIAEGNAVSRIFPGSPASP